MLGNTTDSSHQGEESLIGRVGEKQDEQHWVKNKLWREINWGGDLILCWMTVNKASIWIYCIFTDIYILQCISCASSFVFVFEDYIIIKTAFVAMQKFVSVYVYMWVRLHIDICVCVFFWDYTWCIHISVFTQRCVYLYQIIENVFGCALVCVCDRNTAGHCLISSLCWCPVSFCETVLCHTDHIKMIMYCCVCMCKRDRGCGSMSVCDCVKKWFQ